MFLLEIQIPSLNNIIGFVVLAAAIIFFVLVKRSKRKKEEAELLGHHSTHSPIPASTTRSTSTVDDDPTKDPFDMLSESFGIPVPLLKGLMNVPLSTTCTVTTAKEAEQQFLGAEEDSEEEYFALLKWIQLEDDIDNAGELYKCAEAYHASTEDLAVVTWERLALANVSKLSSQEELENAISTTPTGGESEKLLIKKLYEIYSKK